MTELSAGEYAFNSLYPARKWATLPPESRAVWEEYASSVEDAQASLREARKAFGQVDRHWRAHRRQQQQYLAHGLTLEIQQSAMVNAVYKTAVVAETSREDMLLQMVQVLVAENEQLSLQDRFRKMAGVLSPRESLELLGRDPSLVSDEQENDFLRRTGRPVVSTEQDS